MSDRKPSTRSDDTLPNGGHVVVDTLAQWGANAVFGLHGVQIDPIFQACIDRGIPLVDVRHEASAGFAAEAYARVTGGLGVAAVCPGPGFTNVVTSIANARFDRSSVVYLVGSAPLALMGSNGLQVGLDHVATAAAITKWAARVESVDMLGSMLREAARIATTAPRGPVLLDIPADMLAAPSATVNPSVGAATDQAHVLSASPTQHLSAADIDRCAELLRDAKRPALMVGHTPSAAARTAIADFVERSSVPCFLGYGGLGSLADDHPLFGGTLFQMGRLDPEARPDVVVAVGVQFGFETPGVRDGGAAWGTAVVHIDADPAEIGRFAPARIGIVADPDAALAALAGAIAPGDFSVDTSWLRAVAASRDRSRRSFDSLAAEPGDRMHPYVAGRAISEVAASVGATVVGDGAICKHWLHDALRLPLGARYLTHGRLGCMGTGLGQAIGAALAEPTRPVVCVTGDGAVGFSIAEFETLVRLALPVVVVVMNNARWGASQGFQMRPGGPQRIVGTALPDADYHLVMTAFGGNGGRVETVGELTVALDSALRSGVPTCLNASIGNVGPAPEMALFH